MNRNLVREPVRLGVLGAGEIARKVGGALRFVPELEPYAVAARDPLRAQQYAAELGFAHAWGSYEQMLADPGLELVYIATPHSLHARHSLLCLEAGKHILCEKPFAVNRRQAQEVLTLAKSKGLLAMEAVYPRFTALYRTLGELCGSGALGEVRSLHASLGDQLSHRPRLTDPALAGGALLDLGVYLLHLSAVVLGDRVEGVHSAAQLTPTGVDAQNSVTLQFAGGGMAVLHSSICSYTERRFVVGGSRGFLVADHINYPTRLELYGPQGTLLRTLTRPGEPSRYCGELRAAARAVGEGRRECGELPHAEILRILELTDGIRAQWGLRYPFEGEGGGQ